jgi:hypothetical protein
MTNKVIIMVQVAMTEAEYTRYRHLAVLTGPGTVEAAIRGALKLPEQPYGYTTREYVSEHQFLRDDDDELDEPLLLPAEMNADQAAILGAFIQRVMTAPDPDDGPPYVHTFSHEQGTTDDSD